MVIKAFVLFSCFYYAIAYPPTYRPYDIDSSTTSDAPETDGSRGYEYYSEIHGWLKLHEDYADWYTAKMNCHDEDAVLASPTSEKLRSILWNMLNTSYSYYRHAISPSKALFTGIHSDFSEGVYNYKNGNVVLSLNPADVGTVHECYALNHTAISWVDCASQLPYVCFKPSASVCGDQHYYYSANTKYEVDDRTGQCYKFHYIAQKWNDAHRTCLDEGAHLAIVNSDEEAGVLKDLFAKYPYEKLSGTNPAWGVMAVGFYYWKAADAYVTIHGQTLKEAGYEKWSNGNPSSRGQSKELGGGMFRSGLLDDIDKSYKVPFICEKSPIRT